MSGIEVLLEIAEATVHRVAVCVDDSCVGKCAQYDRCEEHIGRRFIGRQKGYHGVNFGGISVGGLTNNYKTFGQWLMVDHLRHTLDIENNAFSKGLPDHGVEWAEELDELIQFHDASTIAAVIVEPIAGAGGVILLPRGYLKRLREICDQHDILLVMVRGIGDAIAMSPPLTIEKTEIDTIVSTLREVILTITG